MALRGDKWQPHLWGSEKFGLLPLLFELSLIFKCLFQAFPRRGHWRICLISRSHHGAHLYCTEAASSVPSSFSLLLLVYTSMIACKPSYLPHLHFNCRVARGCVSQCFCALSRSYWNQLWWMRLWKLTNALNPEWTFIKVCFSRARKMPCNGLAVDLIRLFNKPPVIRPSLSVIYRRPLSWRR